MRNIRRERVKRMKKDIKQRMKVVKPKKDNDSAQTYKDPLSIQPFKVNASKHRSPPLMEEIGLTHPFSIALYGCSGSGKSVAACQLLCNKNMFRGFFQKIYLFSPTGKADDTFRHLGLPDDQVFTHTGRMIHELDKLVTNQESEASDEDDNTKLPKICIILEDLTSQRELMKSQAFIKAFVQNRHINISTIACCHKYKSLIPVARLNSFHSFIFPCSNTEVEAIREDFQGAGMSKDQFRLMCVLAFRGTDEMQRPFLWINNKARPDEKYRKSLSQILSIKKSDDYNENESIIENNNIGE